MTHNGIPEGLQSFPPQHRFYSDLDRRLRSGLYQGREKTSDPPLLCNWPWAMMVEDPVQIFDKLSINENGLVETWWDLVRLCKDHQDKNVDLYFHFHFENCSMILGRSSPERIIIIGCIRMWCYKAICRNLETKLLFRKIKLLWPIKMVWDAFEVWLCCRTKHESVFKWC